MTERIICGDALYGLSQIESGTVDMCVTSPPYYGLRDYGMLEQIGFEETPELYIERLVEVFREVRRVLKDEGTLWVNIGDSYAGSGKGSSMHKQGTNKSSMIGCGSITRVSAPNCKPKDLIGIPWMLAFALRADGWYLRQDIIWHKPNPMPESVKDRCTNAHEYIFLLSKSRQYYFDNEAISEESLWKGDSRAGYGRLHYRRSKRNGTPGQGWESFVHVTNKRNKRDVWTVNVQPYKGAHFATFPPELIRPCILAGSRDGGIVLDPFLGSGTTAIVALEEQRGYIGIELNPEYAELASKRISETMVNYKITL